ncbi:la-related protein 6-like [Chiroxiphia lanceolata]|uniref:la-related protein 6-like n=1 Tax=Chiroxiphia lanceolata TaxID=296741 RepID=UPI0013CEBFC8|nr:la-related protein 6-like [Chiroxiphia lanceolata]
MSSCSSGGASGLDSRPRCNTPGPVQGNSFLARHLLPPRSRSLALLSQEDALESFDGSARRVRDLSDALGSDLLDRSCSLPDPQLVRRIVSQVEFYLSDENLARDAFLLKHVQKNKMGFVSIKLLTSFKKVKYLTRDWQLTLYALKFSELLEVNKEGTKVRRRVPIPEALLSIPPSKLLLAWELQPQEQDPLLLPLLQENFLEIILRMFSPFGAIASIRVLRPGRKLPSDVRRYSAKFPELLSRCCALVEYESLDSACRAFEDLGHRDCDSGIKVVRLCGKGNRRKPGEERQVVEELVDQPGWKVQGAALSLPYSHEDSLLCSSPGSDDASGPLSLLLNKDPVAPAWPGSNFKPGNFSAFTGSLITSSKVFPPLGLGLGTSSCYSPRSSTKSPCSGWGGTTGAWGPWSRSPSPDIEPPPGNPLAPKWVSEPLSLWDEVLHLPHSPDDTKGFGSNFGSGKLVLRH